MIFDARTGPHHALNFQAFKAADFKPSLNQAIEKARARVQAIRTAPASFENTVVGLEECGEELDFIYNVFSNLLIAESNDELQNLAQVLGPRVADFYNEILLDSDIFKKIEDVYQKRSTLDLDTEQTMLVERLYSDFERRGAKLPEEKKKRLKEIDQKLAGLHPNFGQNVLKAMNAFELYIQNEDELAGLPESVKESLATAATEKGHDGQWLITLHAPSYVPVMKYADNRELREKLWRAYGARAFGGEYDNQKNILELVGLNAEKMKLLGYESFARFAIEKRMAETPEAATEFMKRLLKVSKPVALKEVTEVQKFADESGGPNPIQRWDFAYYSEKLKARKYAFEEEELRPYFPLENVVQGVIEHARRLYGLKFQLVKNYSVYHPDVSVYEVSKAANGEFIGLLYMDFFPRPGKRPGAWMTSFLEQGLFQKRLERPHVSIVCNFTKPTATKPSLLDFREVSTLFHEFGHSLHGLLSQCHYRSLSGTNVYLDFVELPSQLMENWILEEESLKLFARHYQTGEVIPTELIEKVKASDRFQAGYNCVRQLQFGFLDMAWYSADPMQITSVAGFEREAIKDTEVLPPAEGSNISCSFSHIFAGGYAAGYYSYKWAEALDADAFEMFKEHGIFDPKVAHAFEENVLQRGGTEHPMKLFERFRGRKPDPDALLRRDGLLN